MSRRRVAQYVLGDVGHCAVEILVRPGVEVGQGDLEGWTGVRCHRPSFPQPTRASHRLAGYDSSLAHATPTSPCTNDTDAPASTGGTGRVAAIVGLPPVDSATRGALRSVWRRARTGGDRNTDHRMGTALNASEPSREG